MSKFGFVIKALPITSICCSPPDKVEALWYFLSDNFGNKLKTISSDHSPSTAVAVRFSKTVKFVNALLPSGTRPIPS